MPGRLAARLTLQNGRRGPLGAGAARHPLADTPSARPAPGQGVRIPSVIPCAIPGAAAEALRFRRSNGRFGEPGCPPAWEGGGVGKERSLCRRQRSERLCELAVPWLVFKETTANLAARLRASGDGSRRIKAFSAVGYVKLPDTIVRPWNGGVYSSLGSLTEGGLRSSCFFLLFPKIVLKNKTKPKPPTTGTLKLSGSEHYLEGKLAKLSRLQPI